MRAGSEMAEEKARMPLSAREMHRVHEAGDDPFEALVIGELMRSPGMEVVGDPGANHGRILQPHAHLAAIVADRRPASVLDAEFLRVFRIEIDDRLAALEAQQHGRVAPDAVNAPARMAGDELEGMVAARLRAVEMGGQ